jgi:hypothetical protein
MAVTNLECRTCGSSLHGSFELPLLSRLNAEQQHFVEVMIKHRGNIRNVSDELGMAYSAGRAELDTIIAALGFEVADEEEESGISAEERQKVLQELRDGKISSEQAIKKLRGK